MRLAILTAAAATLLAAPALHAAAPSCDIDGVSFPRQTATAHADLARAAKALGAPLTPPKGKSAWAFAKGDTVVAVVAKPGGGYWLLTDLADLDPTSECSGADVSVVATSPTIVRVRTDDGDPDEGCEAEFNMWEHVVIDDATGQVLAAHYEFMGGSVGPEGPTAAVKAGVLEIDGDLSVSASLKDLAACATPAGLTAAKAAAHWVNRGRKATKAKRFDDAIAAFHHALSIDHTTAAAHSGLGYAMLTRGNEGDARKSVKHLEAALRHNTDTKFQGMVQYNLGLAALAQAQLPLIPSAKKAYQDKAVAAFEAANTLRPSAAAAGKLAEAKTLGKAAKKPAAGSVSADFCSVVSKPAPTPKTFASIADFGRATFGDRNMIDKTSICADDDHACGERAWVTSAEPTYVHDVTLVGPGGDVTVLPDVFMTWSGAFCPWGPVFEFQDVGDYTVVTMRADTWSRWEGQCDEEGTVIQAAIIDRKAKTVVGKLGCSEGVGGQGAVLLQGQAITFSDCDDTVHTGTISALKACK